MEELNEKETVKWSLLKKFLFFFIFFYSFFYVFHPAGYIIGVDALSTYIASHLLHTPNLSKIEVTGSGDTTFDYIRILVFLLLAFALAVIASIMGRKKSNYSKLFYLFYVSARYYLAMYMIFYGFAKVFKSQFPFPSLASLEERYGNSSPMKLLWNFMGYSTPYTIFAGMGEVLGGVLLLFRRTAIIGAFLSLVIMANVAAMNFCYDVPVKLFSIHLVLFSIFILIPHAKNLYFYLTHRETSALELFTMPFEAKWLKTTRVVLKMLVFCLVGFMAFFTYFQMKKYGDGAPYPPLFGIYKTVLFVHFDDTIPPFETDSLRWNRLIIDKRLARIDFMTEKSLSTHLDVDSLNGIINIESGLDNKQNNKFTYTFKNDTLIMQGNWNSYSLYIKLKKVDLNKFLLIDRGFHWINEYPFNR